MRAAPGLARLSKTLSQERQNDPSCKMFMVSTTDKGQKVTVNMTGRRIGDCSK